ncbi:hypothetical protein BJX64DRAFT_295095 [Aspergillus heterothallicus]
MKVITTILILSLSLSTLSIPTPPTKRSVTDYTTLFADLTTSINDLTTTITLYTSSSIPATTLQDSATTILAAFTSALNTLYALPLLTAAETLAIINPLIDTRDAADSMIDSLIAAQPYIVADGLEAWIADFLHDLGELAGWVRDETAYNAVEAYAGTVYSILDDVCADVGRGLAEFTV